MSASNWCLLCLHDGSEEELVDVFSVSDLSKRIEEEYDIRINRTYLPAKICMPCFQETLNFRKQRRLYLEEKERILKNQILLRSSTSQGVKPPVSATSNSFKEAFSCSLVKQSNGTTQHNESASKSNAHPRTDANVSFSGNALVPEKAKEGSQTIKFKKKNASSATQKCTHKHKNASSADKIDGNQNIKRSRIADQNKQTKVSLGKQGFISPKSLFKNKLEAKKRVRFSNHDDMDDESISPPQKRIKPAGSVVEANVSRPKKQGIQNGMENKISQSLEPHGIRKAQQQQTAKSKGDPQKIVSKNQRPSASSGSEKSVSATTNCVVANKTTPAVAVSNAATLPAMSTTVEVGNRLDTGSPKDPGRPKPSNAMDNVEQVTDPLKISIGNIGETGTDERTLKRDSNNTTGPKQASQPVQNSKASGAALITEGNLIPTSIIVSQANVTGSAKQMVVPTVVGPTVSESPSFHGSAVEAPINSAFNVSYVLALPSPSAAPVGITSTSNLCARTLPVSSNRGETATNAVQHGRTTTSSSALLSSTCVPSASSTYAHDNVPVHISASNAAMFGVTSILHTAGTDSFRQMLHGSSGLSPAVITVSECESIYTTSPLASSTKTATASSAATSVTDEVRTRSVITVTPTVHLQPTVTKVACLQPLSTVVSAPSQQQTTVPVTTTASLGSQAPTNVGIKKRRHSTFIRVNPNLFDEPADQFASLRKNLLIRTAESTVSTLQISPFLVNSSSDCPSTNVTDQQAPARSTVDNTTPMQFRVSSGGMLQVSTETNRTQATSVNCNQRFILGQNGVQPATAPLAQIPVNILSKPSREVISRTVMENQILPNGPRMVVHNPQMNLVRGPSAVVPSSSSQSATVFIRNQSGIQRQTVTLIRTRNPTAQAPVISSVANTNRNSSVAPGIAGGDSGVMSRCFPNVSISTVANASPYQAALNQPASSTNATSNANSSAQNHPILMCQLCAEFFLTKQSIALHFNQVHYLEYSQSLYTTLYDEKLWKVLVTGARRKSIASTDDFRSSR